MKKKLISLILTFCMMLSLAPAKMTTLAMAADDTSGQTEGIVVVETVDEEKTEETEVVDPIDEDETEEEPGETDAEEVTLEEGATPEDETEEEPGEMMEAGGEPDVEEVTLEEGTTPEDETEEEPGEMVEAGGEPDVEEETLDYLPVSEKRISSLPASDGAVAVITGNLPEGAIPVISAVILTEEELVSYFGEERAAAMTGYVAYDIKILVDGEEWQPDETVNVTVKQPDIVSTEETGIGALHIDSETGEVSNLETEITEEGDLIFDTDGFSLFIFFTVDFYNIDGSVGYCLLGRTSIYLSELLGILDYDIPVEQITSARFSDSTLLKVEKEGNDWLLTSLEPFDTEEYLYLTLANGQEISIYVLDDQTTGGGGGTSPSDVSVDKVGKVVEGKPGEYEVTLTVSGRKEEEQDNQYTDVILVMDVTSSLGNNAEKEKDAAKALIHTLLDDTDSMARVALIQFTDMQYGESKFLNSGTANGSYFYTHETVNGAIADVDSIPDNTNRNNGSTNIQLGLIMAERILQSSECEGSKPVVILMTDGAPNRAMRLGSDSSLTYLANPHQSNHSNNVGVVGANGSTGSYSGPGGDADYYRTYPNEDVSKYAYFVPGGMNFVNPINADGTFKKYSDCERSFSSSNNYTVTWVCAQDNLSNKIYSNNAIGVCQSTYYEGCVVKSMAEFYTVGLKLNTNTQKMLTKMATDDQHSISVSDFSKLKDALNGIATRIKNAATNVSVTDPMGPNVGLMLKGSTATYTNTLADYQAGNADVYISVGSLAYNTESDTISWTIGDVPFGATLEMRYRVKIDEGVFGENIPLNENAVVSYKDLTGTDKTKDFPVPVGEAEEPSVMINYVAVPEEGGSVGIASESVKVLNGIPTGSTAAAAPGFKFVGWFSDATCSVKISESNKFIPSKNETTGKYETATYYAKFEEELGNLTINKSGCSSADANQSFIFRVTSTNLENTSHDAVDMYVTIQGNGSVTITDLPIGSYKVEEESSWSWRYTSDGAKNVTVDTDGESTTIANTRTNSSWLSGSAYAINAADGKKNN